MPDFDVDFCMDRRDEVIDYVARKYGRDHVSQIITYGTMAAKGVIRDVGRVLGFAYGFVDRISKLIPNELGITLKDAIEKEPELKDKYENDEEVSYLLSLALKLEGLARNVGRHAGGVVIGPRPLWTFAPMYCEADGSNLVTQFDKSDVESVGLVKFDFLGLRTLTIIDWAVKGINTQQLPAVMRETGSARADGPIVDISRIPLDDAKTYQMIKTGNTSGVFQLESTGMQDLIRRLQPDCFEDIVALVALFRPGPLGSGMVDDFINRKHGRQKVEYLHPMLEPILNPTYGTIYIKNKLCKPHRLWLIIVWVVQIYYAVRWVKKMRQKWHVSEKHFDKAQMRMVWIQKLQAVFLILWKSLRTMALTSRTPLRMRSFLIKRLG